MNSRTLSIIGIAVLTSTAGATAAESKRTADYLLTTPFSFEGKEVTLDVAFVKPVHWVCPIPGLMFFHALTVDQSDNRPGGSILVAIASTEAAAFAKKYGTDFERGDRDSLKGVFLAVSGRRAGPETPPSSPHVDPRPGRKIWVIDTTGELKKLIEQNTLEIPREVGEGGPGPKHRPGPR